MYDCLFFHGCCSFPEFHCELIILGKEPGAVHHMAGAVCLNTVFPDVGYSEGVHSLDLFPLSSIVLHIVFRPFPEIADTSL